MRLSFSNTDYLALQAALRPRSATPGAAGTPPARHNADAEPSHTTNTASTNTPKTRVRAPRPTINIDGVLDTCEREAITVLLPHMPAWPSRFEHLGAHAPRVLFLRGSLPPVPHIAVIGTRAPSSYGLRVTEHLVRELAITNIGILSGMALGIDGKAHESALASQLPTTAILGLGVTDAQIYPHQHLHLVQRIIETGGCILSEVPPGQNTHRGAFPQRNRLIAALCQALLVIEAKDQSGTLITARIALELGREVLAVPGPIFSPQSVGTHKLLQSGASICTAASDIWAVLTVDRPMIADQTKRTLHPNTQDTALIELLRAESEGLTVDQCALQLQLPEQAIASRLGLLELQGLIQQLANGRWILSGLAY